MSQDHPSGDLHDGANPRQRTPLSAWWMLAVLLLFYVFSYLDRYLITMLVPPIKSDLHLSDFQVSLILGPAFALFFGIFGLPLGWAADRYPRRWVVFIGVVLWSGATAACGLARGFGGLFFARAGVGVGEAALSPAAYSLIGDAFPLHRVATASSIYQMGVKLGSAAAFSLGAVAITAAAHFPEISLPGVGLLRPWQLVFMMTGVPGLFLSLLVFTFSEPHRKGRSGEARGMGELVAFARLHGPMLGLMLAGFGLISVAAFALTAWTPTYISRTFGWTPIQYGPALSVVSVLAAATLVLKGGILDWMFARGVKDAYLRLYTWLLLASLPAAAAVYFVPNVYLFFVLFGVIQLVAIPIMVYIVPTIHLLAPNQLRGQLIAVFLFVSTLLGLGVGPMLVGALTDFVFRSDDRVGWSLAVVLAGTLPVALICLRFALKPLLRAARIAGEA
jgi:MFS family permease